MATTTTTRLIVFFLFLSVLGCTKSNTAVMPASQGNSTNKSSAKDIISLSIEGITIDSAVIITAVNTLEVFVPIGTDVKALKLKLNLSIGATVKPASGTAQNFTNPVTYVITAEDGSTVTYIVKVSIQTQSIITGKSCLLTRIERVDTKTYYNFKYDAQRRVTHVDAFIEPNSIGVTANYGPKIYTLDCIYNSMGNLDQVNADAGLPYYSSRSYKFIYSNNKLTRVIRSDGGRDVILTVNAQNQIASINTDITMLCEALQYNNGSIIKITDCYSMPITKVTLSYKDSKNPLYSQLNNPAFLFIFREFTNERNDVDIHIFSAFFSINSPYNLTIYNNSGTSAIARYNINYINNSIGFPTEANVLYEPDLSNIYFPNNVTFKYRFTYSDCQ